ncbi:MAG: hypothetical protein ACK53Y_27435, partial [bacterium]
RGFRFRLRREGHSRERLGAAESNAPRASQKQNGERREPNPHHGLGKLAPHPMSPDSNRAAERRLPSGFLGEAKSPHDFQHP